MLFSIQDIPVLKDLALYREESYTDNADHQPVSGRFTGRG